MKLPLRISTRGYYDLLDGKTIRNNSYRVYPKNDFKELSGCKELVIMIHGFRNDNAGALDKALLAKKRLRKLGYRHPVIGFSYDSNTVGAYSKNCQEHALAVGQIIAKKNGKNLGTFIEDFKAGSPDTEILLMGHSLGSQVILSTMSYLARKKKNAGILKGVYFFGASVNSDVPSSKKYIRVFDSVVKTKIVNYYAPSDEVLSWAHENLPKTVPLGLYGATKTKTTKLVGKYRDRMVKPKNHRFASYVATLNSFP